ncbi:MAG TPA: hypothetical protein VFX86_03965 [Candidatus Saccharimonadales bacterium]|nr:hypothetical protein [Candidatus Saccharimonadales bacterium]
MLKWLMRSCALLLAAVLCSGCIVAVTYAETLKSPNYQFDESVLGAGGVVRSGSANYQTGQSIGDTAINESSSSNFQFQAGSQTTSDPALSFAVNDPSVNFGDFSAAATATATSSFSVSNYTSYGYAVQMIGDPPSNNNDEITAMTTTGPSQTGQEQFGINLVTNTVPTSFGDDPDNGQFGNGEAAANYNTSNQYRYVDGETIATAPKSSGVTDYTISYIVNVSNLTPGGRYSSSQSIICTGVF